MKYIWMYLNISKTNSFASISFHYKDIGVPYILSGGILYGCLVDNSQMSIYRWVTY
jgi:hypothetical protein